MPIRNELIAAIGRASESQTVVWVGPSRTDMRADFEVAADVVGVGAKVRRANGAESIEFPNGGRVVFMSAPGRGGRGFSADRVYVPADADDDLVVEASLMTCTSANPAIVGYFR